MVNYCSVRYARLSTRCENCIQSIKNNPLKTAVIIGLVAGVAYLALQPDKVCETFILEKDVVKYYGGLGRQEVTYSAQFCNYSVKGAIVEMAKDAFCGAAAIMKEVAVSSSNRLNDGAMTLVDSLLQK